MKVSNGIFLEDLSGWGEGGTDNNDWGDSDPEDVEKPVLKRAFRRTDKRSVPFTGEGRRPRSPEDPTPKSREELGLPRRKPRWYPAPAEKKTAEELAAAVRRVDFKTVLCGGGLEMRLFNERKEGVCYTCPGCKDVKCIVCYN
tara:strand:- start:58 stop:486 length:429 start_codon:yes stop_codon:yes gene_type:complete